MTEPVLFRTPDGELGVVEPFRIRMFGRFLELSRKRVALGRHCAGWYRDFRTGMTRLEGVLDSATWRGVPEMGGWPRRRLPPIDWKREGWLEPPENETQGGVRWA
jgi:hypothetical protein